MTDMSKFSSPTRWTPRRRDLPRARHRGRREARPVTRRVDAIIGDYDGLAVRSSTQGHRGGMDAALPRLKVIGRAGIGVDNDRRARRVGARHRRHEHAVRQFDHHRRACDRDDVRARPRDARRPTQSTQAGKWEKNRFMGVELAGKTLGLIGCGNIGSIVADRAHGLQDEGRRLRSVPLARARASSSASRRSSSTSCSPAPTSSPCTRR